MPQLRMKNISPDNAKIICKGLIDELEQIIGCPREYFTIECVNSVFITDGTIPSDYPFIEIHWFDRGQEQKDKIAKCITKYIQKLGYESVDVIFNAINTKDYYENGKSF